MNEQKLLIGWWVASFVNWFCIAWWSILTAKLRRLCLLHFSITPFSLTCTSGHGLLNWLHLQAFLLFVNPRTTFIFCQLPDYLSSVYFSTFINMSMLNIWNYNQKLIFERWCLKVRAVFAFLSASSRSAREASAWENPWSLCMLGVSLCLGKFEWRKTNDISWQFNNHWHFKSSRGFWGSASYIVRWAAAGKSRILLRFLAICLWL